MEYGKIKGIDKKCSRFIIGTMQIHEYDGPEEELKKLDAAWERGCNVIDSAHGYGWPNEGSTETALGKWVKSRGFNREDYVLTTKCAHTSMIRSRLHEYDMESELHDSLVRWGVEYVDVLYLHRDDPTVPVAEVINALNKFKRQGLVRAFGAANWKIARVREANEYAEANGLQGFSIVEEHYSVAAMHGEPFMPGSGSISGPDYAEDRKWLVDNEIPVASYSALSGGFCTGRFTREQFEKDPDSIPRGVRAGYCYPDNFERMDRAAALAAKKGISMAQLCMAYTMSGEMDVYPIIGARNEEELESTLSTLNMRLTKEECDWIDLTSDREP